ncbi:MAG: hypothetical protein ACREJO_01430 [Phycisphaerales bacterium]
MNSPAPPTEPTVERVDVHRECLGCGYDLWNQPVKGVCSECGRDVRLTLATRVWAWDEPDRAARFAKGLRTMAAGVLMAGGSMVLTALGAIVTGGNSDVVPMVGGAAVMCSLAVYVAGLARATLGAPVAPVLGFLSAGLMAVFVVIVVTVIMQAAGIIGRPNVPEKMYVGCVAGAAVGQGMTLGLWLCLNSEVVSSRRRSAWMMWCGLIGASIAGTIGVVILALNSGVQDYLRPGTTSFVVYLLMIWGVALAGLLWSAWASFLWLRISRRVDSVRAAMPRRRG